MRDVALGYPGNEPEEMSDTESGVQGLVNCIIDRFNRVSTNRIHKIAFILEYEYNHHTGDRITNAEYYRVMDGCRSDSVSKAIENLSSIERKEVNIAGERVDTIVPKSDIECDFNLHDDDTFDQLADNVIEICGGIPPEEINEKMESIPPYKRTKLGEKIEF